MGTWEDGGLEPSEYLELVEQVVNGFLARGVPAYIDRGELIHVCLINLQKNISQFEGRNGASLKTFLKVAIRHDVLHHLERERRYQKHIHRPIGGNTDDDPHRSDHEKWAFRRSGGPDPDLPRPPRLAYENVFYQASHLLTPKQFEVLSLRFEFGLTTQQTAEKLGIAPTAVEGRWRKAQVKLRRGLKKTLHGRYEN